jgi:hypothetical protein
MIFARIKFAFTIADIKEVQGCYNVIVLACR